MVSAFMDYQNGHLPVPGGMLDQAGTFADAMQFLAGLKGFHEKLDFDKAANGR